MRHVRGAHADVVRVVQLELARHAADLVVLDGANRPVDRRHREQAIEERQLLLARRQTRELARDDEVFGAAVTEVLAARDPHDERGAVGRQAAARRHELLDQRRLLVADLVIGARHAVEDVGETRDVPGLPRVEPGQRALDLAQAVDRRAGVFLQAEPFMNDTRPPSCSGDVSPQPRNAASISA